jgi:RluA family pseudouridine synthase
VRIASKELQSGAKVDAYVDLEKLLEDGAGRDRPWTMEASHVLYEDEWLIAVDKPPGLPTQPTLDEARLNLFAAVKKFLAARDGGQPYVGLHHRLDRDTSGVVLFTKKAQANAGVADLFAQHGARKTYLAIAARPARPPGEHWTVRNFLGKGALAGGKRTKFRSVRSGGDAAHTDFDLRERLDRALLVEARPLTGRTHQIRVHLSEAGMPILGDDHYASAESARLSRAMGIPRLMLHAVNLTFPHPVTNVNVSIPSPIPEDFTRCLAKLRDSSGAS